MEFLEKVEIKQEPFDEDEVSETAEESVSIKNKSVENGQVKFSETEISDKVNLIKDEEKSADRNESPVKEPDPTVNSNSMLNHASCTKRENDELPSTSNVNDSMTMGDSDVKHNDTDELFKPEEILIKVEPNLSEDESVDGKDVTDDDDEFGEADPIKENEFVSDEDEEMSCDWNESEPAESERDPLALDSVLQIDIKTESPSDEESTYITSESASTSKADDVPYCCRKCRCGFRTSDQHEEHEKICVRSDESVLSDSYHESSILCDALTRPKTLPKSQTSDQSEEKPHTCTVCRYSTKRLTDMKKHMRIHSGERPFKCTQCDYSTVRAHALKTHIRIHTGEKPYKCTMCDYSAAKFNNLKKHISFHTGEKPYKCSQCDYSTVFGHCLTKHVKIHGGQKPYKCAYCDYSSFTAADIKKHTRKHTGEKPYNCTVCDYSSGRRDILKKHMRTHTGEKPYQCTLCDYSGTVLYMLTVHMRSHSGERPFKCEECDYSSTSMDVLKKHMRTHTGERPYKCSHCSYCSATSYGVKRHIKTHTNKSSKRKRK